MSLTEKAIAKLDHLLYTARYPLDKTVYNRYMQLIYKLDERLYRERLARLQQARIKQTRGGASYALPRTKTLDFSSLSSNDWREV